MSHAMVIGRIAVIANFHSMARLSIFVDQVISVRVKKRSVPGIGNMNLLSLRTFSWCKVVYFRVNILTPNLVV